VRSCMPAQHSVAFCARNRRSIEWAPRKGHFLDLSPRLPVEVRVMVVVVWWWVDE
jgi:hypothetical protein